MKKFLLIALLTPLFIFAQEREYIWDKEMNEATTYSETGEFFLNRSVGGYMAAGGVFLFGGATIHLINGCLKMKTPENYYGFDSYEIYQKKFNKRHQAATVIGWSCIGLSAVLFFTGGVIYAKQDRQGKYMYIVAGANSISLTYNL